MARTGDEVLAYCLAKPGAEQDEPWEGDVVTKVGGKIFAFHGEHSVGIKCGRNPDDTAELLARFPDDVSTMPYIGRFGWCNVTIRGAIPDDEVRELVDASYDTIVAKLPKSKRP